MKGSLDFVILIQILAKEWLFRILLSLGPAPGIREALKKCLLEERTALAHPFPKNQILSQKQILRLQVEGAFILSKALPTATEKVSPEPLSSAAWPPLSPRGSGWLSRAPRLALFCRPLSFLVRNRPARWGPTHPCFGLPGHLAFPPPVPSHPRPSICSGRR